MAKLITNRNPLGQEKLLEQFSKWKKANEFPSSVLLEGDAGPGILDSARSLARSLFCRKTAALDCDCDDCGKIDRDSHPDMRWVGQDEQALSIKLDEVHALVRWSSLKAAEAARKLAVIVMSERLGIEAANAFLKTLEEPPKGQHFLLLTSSTQLMMPTIQSRCHSLKLMPVPARRLSLDLATRLELQDDEASALARMSRGSVSRAESLATLDRGSMMRLFVDQVLAEPVDGLEALAQLKRKELLDTLDYMVYILRDLAVYSETQSMALLLDPIQAPMIKKAAPSQSAAVWMDIMDEVLDARKTVKANANAKIVMMHLGLQMQELMKNRKGDKVL